MNDFLESLKADLLDRRMRPFVAVAVLALVGALAYTAFAGSSHSTPPSSSAHTTPTGLGSGVPITANSRQDALVETTSGGATQKQGSARDPFQEGVKATVAATTGVSTASTPSSSSSGGSASEPSSSSSSSSPSSSPTPSSTGSSGSSKHSSQAPKTVYELDAIFGEVPGGQETAPQPETLAKLALLTPLPSKKIALLVYRGVTEDGRTATFTVAGEAILSGPGVCKPSPYDCESVGLKAGQAEDVAYLPAGSESTVTYELKIVSITASEASSAKVQSLWRGRSAAGLEVLRAGNLMELPGLRESEVAGVLVPVR